MPCPQSVSSVVVLLRAQDSAGWANPSLTRIYAQTLAFTIDQRSKVSFLLVWCDVMYYDVIHVTHYHHSHITLSHCTFSTSHYHSTHYHHTITPHISTTHLPLHIIKAHIIPPPFIPPPLPSHTAQVRRIAQQDIEQLARDMHARDPTHPMLAATATFCLQSLKV